MGFKCGIVGLPNVGKSTLFNALTRTAAAQAANYPFCTIEPNTGEVAVPDPRLKAIADIARSKEIVPTRISFVDIAGLVRGASKGEGLGNQFLANIREVDAIVHVLRCFEDDDVTHVEGRVDPVADAETIETELMIADLESLERRADQTRKRATGKDKDALLVLPLMDAALALLQDGKPVRTMLRGHGRRGAQARQGAQPSDLKAGALCLQRRRSGRRRRQCPQRRGGEDGRRARRRVRRDLGRHRGRGRAVAGRGGEGIPRRTWASTNPGSTS